MAWRVTVRIGPKVERLRFPDLKAALDAVEARAREAASQAVGKPVDAKIREFTPVQQVAARIELAGPQRLLASVRGGIDVRGDGSTEAYLGRVKREVVEQKRRETAYQALRRALGSS